MTEKIILTKEILEKGYDELYNYINLAINNLDDMVYKSINYFFETDLFDMYIDSQFDLADNLYNQLDDNGIVEYII